MLVVPPLREPRQVLEYIPRVCVENMRTILVNENAVLVVVVVGIAADMRRLSR